ncbi:hypothetical protein ACHAW5_005738 [Stephanodiscus triporus]|uniref:Uncharacterized protein n=1 Tax=Stephanodiscus triporus TaxID=2934178 RepID=A0ABD3P225_9STRA
MILQILLILALSTSTSAYVSIVTGANGFGASHRLLSSPDKVSYEKSYWRAHVEEFQQSSKHDMDACVLVLPYDMLDNGETLMYAMEAAVKNSTTKDCPICIYHIASVFGPHQIR